MPMLDFPGEQKNTEQAPLGAARQTHFENPPLACVHQESGFMRGLLVDRNAAPRDPERFLAWSVGKNIEMCACVLRFRFPQ